MRLSGRVKKRGFNSLPVFEATEPGARPERAPGFPSQANMNNGSKTAHEKRARRAPAEKNR
jgi:hypothetical protein